MGASRRSSQFQSGLSLIELMISILIGALLLLGTVSLFQQSRMSSAQDERIARMQENGRFALRLLSRELSMMGYWGGVMDPDTITTSDASAGEDCLSGAGGWTLDLEPVIELDADANGSAYPECIDDDEILAGTDVLAIKRVADQSSLSVDDVGTPTGSVVDGDIYLKTNSVLGSLYGATSDDDTGPSAVPQPFKVYSYLPTVLYVRPWSVDEGDGIPTLVRETLRGADMVAEPLVEGIENLQVEFGIDNADTGLAPDYYVATPSVSELEKAVTARVFVLVRSIDPMPGYVNDKSYRLGGVDVDASDDGFYRRVYSTTVQLRNSPKLKLLALN